ncbi:alpha-L-arabinofuranosidase C-terminal domain-containing protein [Mucilaginibacter psychrotolerans]|uniref:non-reducing end alpha-L-arabinofuranosidase n=1 Tax=Mucilaginibacter psychrotolerans TaxID=1524096 RepID=A0A4Y8SQY0_9SPHI|nr:alpha-L-arabinofuranosidase C-terminal domain-containing protein [Mucilaginibacter psychrotolerans]TFF40981.1 alpha-L-arabinofuranosidase [Mucilaginibacter psychrotolerans]
MHIKKIKYHAIFLVLFAVSVLPVTAKATERPAQPDSAYLFAYASAKNNHDAGLQLAWSVDKTKWESIGTNYGFVKSDYGPWGRGKKMFNPFLFRDRAGLWHCVWGLGSDIRAFAHAASVDLINWKRQSYPAITKGDAFLNTSVTYDAAQNTYHINYSDKKGKHYRINTVDFKAYSASQEVPDAAAVNQPQTLNLAEGAETGNIALVARPVLDKLVNTFKQRQRAGALNSETLRKDSATYSGLKPLSISIKPLPATAKPISDMLIGIFFEDINYAADGGLYAEMIQNRDFEYAPADKSGRDANWNSTYAWKVQGDGISLKIDSVAPINAYNQHYAQLSVNKPGGVLYNTGYDGIALKKDGKYNFTFFGKADGASPRKIKVKLVSAKQGVVAEAVIKLTSTGWKKWGTTLVPAATVTDAALYIEPLSSGKLALDMVSLFPANTYKNRPNGMRTDLADAIADIHPRFVRFPGGCVAHGDGLDNIYRWKNTIGPVETRIPQRNLWGYHQSAGLGFHEYFQFCEDIGAAPVPVIAAGVPCQNSSTGGDGQQGGIPMADMQAYIQDINDLVEYANGAVTTTWGKKRAQAGHPKPFNLKYVGIGNEDLISDIFEVRFKMIFNALAKSHPEITVIGTVGPFHSGTDFVEGWDVAGKLKVPVVDEHYYESPGWFINNQSRYDSYDRTKSKVYLGEYAAHAPGGQTNLETALAEALYLTSLERNGDVVKMASYAPLLAKENHTQWNPDMIYFNNTEVKPTTGYYVQTMFGKNAGDIYMPSAVTLSDTATSVKKRIGISVVKDKQTGDVIIKMANLLPVEVNAGIDLSSFPALSATATKSVLTGNLADKFLKPGTTQIKAPKQLTQTLPAYSFTVIRIPAKPLK